VGRLLTAAVFAALAGAALGQDRPAFEAASLKPSPPLSPKPRGLSIYPGGRIVGSNCTLRQLIRSAYGLDTRAPEMEVLGGPAWLDQDRFDLEAKPPESSQSGQYVPLKSTAPITSEIRLMLQTLLADRFQLKVHMDSKLDSVLALTVDKGGSRLKKSDETKAPSLVSSHTGPIDRMATLVTGQNATMAMLAGGLAQLLRRPVLDRTSLTGGFDFHLVYPPDDGSGSAPPLFKALQRQLGLKLEAQKASLDVLVVDHAEKPSSN
jgi:uncharacterized protein (TIGR03435 family)